MLQHERANERFTRPSDVAMVFGIPCSEELFHLSRETMPQSFATQFIGGVAQFRHQWLSEQLRYSERFEAIGVRVFRDCRFEQLRQCLGDPSIKVVVVFSHWDDGHVEFTDGFVGSDAIVEAIPRERRKWIDLCVCHPVTLVERLERERPDCLVRFKPEPTNPVRWLLWYDALFRLLATGTRSYTGAFEELSVSLFSEVARQ